MAAKAITLLVVMAALAEVQSVNQITLPDQTRNHISNPLIPFGIMIPKFWFDILQTCHVIFPNGRTYEVYPNNNLPDGPISYTPAVQPFTSCGIDFLYPPVSASGTYELISLVNHTDASLTMTRQRFNVFITMYDPWKADV